MSIGKSKLEELLGRQVDIISTIDHPFASPPVRLFDGHYNYFRYVKNRDLSPLVFVWDANYPTEQRKRVEMVFDTGLIGGNLSDISLFKDGIFYFKQNPQQLSEELPVIFKKVLGSAFLVYKDLKTNEILSNFEDLYSLYKEVISNSSNGVTFYTNLIPSLYNLFGFDSLGIAFKSNVVSMFGSDRKIIEWICYCLENSDKFPLPLKKCINNSIFTKRLFREISQKNDHLQSSSVNYAYDLNNLSSDIDMLRKDVIVPSEEIFYWCLVNSGIYHYGNDHGIIDTFSRFGHLDMAGLQVTLPKEDSMDLLDFSSDFAFAYDKSRDTVKKLPPNVKPNRINTLTRAYALLGPNLHDILLEKLNSSDRSKTII